MPDCTSRSTSAHKRQLGTTYVLRTKRRRGVIQLRTPNTVSTSTRYPARETNVKLSIQIRAIWRPQHPDHPSVPLGWSNQKGSSAPVGCTSKLIRRRRRAVRPNSTNRLPRNPIRRGDNRKSGTRSYSISYINTVVRVASKEERTENEVRPRGVPAHGRVVYGGVACD